MLEAIDINAQHHELLNKLYKLRDAVHDGAASGDIALIIDEVIAYTRFHLVSEERVLDQFHYPELKWHQDKHQELLDDALKFKAKLDYLGGADFLEWFNHWPVTRLLAHIEYADQQAENFIAHRR